MLYMSTFCDTADVKPKIHFLPYTHRSISQSILEMAAMICLRSSGKGGTRPSP